MAAAMVFRKSAIGVLLITQLFMIIIYFLFVEYDPAAKPYREVTPTGNNTTTITPPTISYEGLSNTYPLFQDIHVMIFVGFGFLVTFMKKYAHSGLGFTFLVAALAIEWAIIVHGFLNWGSDYKIHLSLHDMVYAEEAAAAVLITLGIVLGKVPPLGLIFMTFVEITIYVGNEYLCSETLQSMDWGGSMYLHGFGAYFGLAMSALIAFKTNTLEDNELESSTYIGDVTAMIGTLFLWAFWPSFLAAGFQGNKRYRIIINTYLSLISSCIVTFAISSAFNKKFKFVMAQIQNATLAGGVAIGTTCVCMVHPYGALIIGAVGGFISTLGFAYIQGFLRKQGHIHDTCGAHNLHGLPGIVGGICGVFSAGFANRKTYQTDLDVIYPAMTDGRTAGMQAVYQMVGIFVTLGTSIVGGIITGVVIRFIFPFHTDEKFYKDEEWWVEEGEEEED